MPWEEELMIRFSMIVALMLLALSGYTHGQEKKEKKAKSVVTIRIDGSTVIFQSEKDVVFLYEGGEKNGDPLRKQGKELLLNIEGDKELVISSSVAEENGYVYIFFSSSEVIVVTGPDLRTVIKVGKK